MARYARVSAISPPKLCSYQQGVSFERQLRNVLDFWDGHLDQIAGEQNDMIVLPEVCDALIGAPPEAQREFIAFKGMIVRDHLAEFAKAYQTNIAYSANIALPDGSLRNVIQFINRKGGIDGEYRKNYLTISEAEEKGSLFGKETALIETDFAKVAGVICFDLNFTDLLNRTAALKPELLVFSSAYHGGLMRGYWAYACRAWFVSAHVVQMNQAAVLNPLGVQTAGSTNYFPFVTADINLDYQVAHLDYNWAKLEAARKKYGKKIKIFDPGNLGSVLITSECDEISAQDLVEEFAIERLDDYFARVQAYRPAYLEP